MKTFELSDGTSAHIVEDPSGGEMVLIKRHRQYETDLASSDDVAPFDLYIPYTARHPETVKAAPKNARWVYVGASNVAYYAAMLEWWSHRETLMIIEHDVVCRPDILEAADACPELWCVWNYSPECPCGNPDCREAWRNMLGCTRFRKELIEAVPDALTSIPEDNWDWHNMCDGVGNNLRAAGYTHHWHTPPVEHHCRTANEE